MISCVPADSSPFKPATVAGLQAFVGAAHERSQKISRCDLSGLNRLLEHTAEDMTAIVQAGMILTDFQNELRKHGQWLPIDPPNPERLTVGALLATNVSGPRCFGYGTIRDYLIGIAVVLPDGRLVHSGGKVVKNVAGYDLMKLFIGSHGSLGVIVEATFKVLPRAEIESFVELKCELDQASTLVETVLDSYLRPVVLDLHNGSRVDHSLSLVLGFAGTEEDVNWQLSQAAEFGIREPASLEYERAFFAETTPFAKTSVLPSRIFEIIRSVEGAPFVARCGNGIIYHRGGCAAVLPDRPIHLEDRLKAAFDPNHILPALPT